MNDYMEKVKNGVEKVFFRFDLFIDFCVAENWNSHSVCAHTSIEYPTTQFSQTIQIRIEKDLRIQ